MPASGSFRSESDAPDLPALARLGNTLAERAPTDESDRLPAMVVDGTAITSDSENELTHQVIDLEGIKWAVGL